MFKLNKFLNILASGFMIILALLVGAGMIMGYLTEHRIGLSAMAVLWAVLGVLSLQGTLKMTEKDYRRSHVRVNKYVTRRIFLFLSLVLVFITVAVLVNIRLSARGRDMGRALIIEVILGCAVLAAYVMELVSLYKTRKASRIQDESFADLPIYINDRYFSMVVDELTNEGDSSFLHGFLHGTVKASDKVFFYFSDGSIFKGQVTSILADGISADTVTDSPCVLEINTKGKMQYQPFMICTSLLPYGNDSVERVISNPRLTSLLNGYREQKDKEGYINYLAALIVHSSFMVRVIPAEENSPWYKRVVEYFFGYRGQIRMPVVSGENLQAEALPVYTDWMAYMRGAHGDERQGMAVLMKFEEILHHLHAPISGVVINPFGPADFYIPPAFARTLQQHIEEKKKEKDTEASF